MFDWNLVLSALLPLLVDINDVLDIEIPKLQGWLELAWGVCSFVCLVLIQLHVELGDPQKHFDGDGAEDFGTLRDLCLHEENMCPYSILGYVQIQRDFRTSNPPYWSQYSVICVGRRDFTAAHTAPAPLPLPLVIFFLRLFHLVS